jgi:hypothetical protein
MLAWSRQQQLPHGVGRPIGIQDDWEESRREGRREEKRGERERKIGH